MKKIGIAVGFIVLGLILGRLMFGGSQPQEPQLKNHEHSTEENTLWTCAMHPQIHLDKPGNCPICGMKLIPQKDSHHAISENQIQLSEEAAKLAEIETTIVKLKKPVKDIQMTGKISSDERRKYAQTAHFPGRIEALYVSFTGEKVKKGQKIVSIYSPKLITAQEELFEALKFKDSNPALVESARKKFRLWKLSPQQVEDIEQSGVVHTEFDINSDFDGTVVERKVSLGDHLKQGEVLFKIDDLSHVWALFDAYESDLNWIKLGDIFKFSVSSIPGRVFEAKVTFIDPVVNPKTRIASIRTELDNPDGLLKPEMFANGTIQGSLPMATQSAILVPKTAILWTGKRSLVYIKVPGFESPTFELRTVTIGPESGDSFIVLDGLKEGEEVVSRGEFKIDAAAQLIGKPSMMSPSGEGAPSMNMPGMEGMNMGGSDSKPMEMNEPEKSLAPSSFGLQMGQIFQQYQVLSSSFLKGDAQNIHQSSKDLAKLIPLKKPDADNSWNEKWSEWETGVKPHLDALQKLEDIEKLRMNFDVLSKRLFKAIQTFGLGEENAYYFYCPMAKKYWIDDKETVMNPYFSGDMTGCGELKSQLKNHK